MTENDPTQSETLQSGHRPTKLIVQIVCFLAAISVAVILLRPLWSKSAEQSMVEAEAAFEQGNFQEAERLAVLCLQQQPDSINALLVAARAAEGQGRREDALDYIQHVKLDGSPESFDCVSLKSGLSMIMGHAGAAEELWMQILEQRPEHTESQLGLMTLFRLQGRNWEMRPKILALLKLVLLTPEKSFSAPIKTLVYPLRSVGDTEWVWLEPHEQQLVNIFRESVPDDFLSALGEARMAAAANDVEQAGRVFRKIVAANPHQIEAQAQLGVLLANSSSDVEFLQWSSALPKTADQHPEIWIARGIYAKQHDRPDTAVRCFWEALRLHPHHLRANYQISQLLVSIDRQEEARPFAEKANQLDRLEYLLKVVGSDPAKIQQVAAMMQTLGRPWEAAAWYRIGVEFFPREDWAQNGLRKSLENLADNPPLVLASINPAHQIDLSEFPLPEWEHISAEPREESVVDAGQNIVWEDVAKTSGLRFSYWNGSNPNSNIANMFEFSGGGIAVLDYDNDSWPDIYLTQGGNWPPLSIGTLNSNRLFRNLGNGSFEDVTSHTALAGHDFSQGTTAGDYDNDGFSDIYVANIGGNRFYSNNGDGTYSEVTLPTGTAGDAWTVSCALADFNGDSIPDLYAVNYLGGPDVFKRVCTKNDRLIQCDPPMFPAEQDQLYQNLGDGHFENVTQQSGIVARDGKGMGIIVADFHNARRLDLFIANDTTANFFFVNTANSIGADSLFAEEGLLRGLALSENGQAQSCMGVAIGDVSGNGLADLFVTNFTREPNNLYLQRADHTFTDSARQAKLLDSGFHLMGWGAQFLDGDLDGLLDLVIANGELEDLSDVGVSSKMPLLYYANAGGNRFAAVSASQLGPYFQKNTLGRAIAKLDWNRDGLDDFCVTHVDVPVALLTNRTAQHGHFLAVKLRGVQSSRDAIGTVVSIKTAGKPLTRQLTAGDGFQASNQRRLVFGLGQHERIDELSVTWPSGTEQTFKNLNADQEILLIEGENQPYRLQAE